MLENTKGFSGFSVNDLQKAKNFYQGTLGLKVKEGEMGLLEIYINEDTRVIAYPKPNHEPATFTILNFPVPDLEKAVDQLIAKGITMEQYHFGQIDTDKKGIAHGKPEIAWFKDPAGNIISLIGENGM